MDKKQINDLKTNIKIEGDLLKNNIDQYIIEEKLGEGIFGTVKLATHKITKEKVAIKILNKSRITKAQKTLLSRELSILKKMNHFNIIKLYSIIETESIIYLIQEYSSGKELSDYIQNHSKIDEKEICKFFQQIISGIEYIHNMGIAHRDLKPENILLTRSNDIKIIDFGLSNIYSEGELLKTSCGSPYYAPPEMLQGKPYNGLYSDIYSCGIILYYMLSKKLPFNENNNKDLYKKIIEGKFQMPKNISKDAQDLLKKIIKVNPEERIKIKDIKNHPWFKLADISYNMHSGLNCDKVVFPIDNDIVKSMHELGFNKMEIRYNIIKNEHNNITTTYYLLLDKKIKKGRKSIADLHSNLFDDYINDTKNKIENYKEGIDEAIKERINSKGIIKTIPNFELERKRRRSSIYINNKGRKNSIKRDLSADISKIAKKELSDKIKEKIKNNILNKKEKNNFVFNSNKKKNEKNTNRKIFSAKVKNKSISIKKEDKTFDLINKKEDNINKIESKNNDKEEKEKMEEKNDNTNNNNNINTNIESEKKIDENIKNNIDIENKNENEKEKENNNDKNNNNIIDNKDLNENTNININTSEKIEDERMKEEKKSKDLGREKKTVKKNAVKNNIKEKKYIKTEKKEIKKKVLPFQINKSTNKNIKINEEKKTKTKSNDLNTMKKNINGNKISKIKKVPNAYKNIKK